MKRKLRLLLTLFLALALCFGAVAPTVIYAEGTLPDEKSGADKGSGSLDLEWFKVDYDKDGIVLTLYQDVKSFLDTDKADLKALAETLIDAVKNIILDDLKYDLSSGSDGISIDTMWKTAIDYYIAL